MDAMNNPFKKGMIILWSGAIADIPEGWRLCDGTNNTPNLQNVFVVGAGDTYVVDATGGSINHSHPFEGDGHSHTLAAGAALEAGGDLGSGTDEQSAVGDTDAANGLPPYRALAYIMKS